MVFTLNSDNTMSDKEKLEQAYLWLRQHKDEKSHKVQEWADECSDPKTKEELHWISCRLYHYGEWVAGCL
jgi:hypothetical protein